MQANDQEPGYAASDFHQHKTRNKELPSRSNAKMEPALAPLLF